jgi:hypothetical protein
LVQHLGVERGFHRSETISQTLSSLVVDYGEALSDIDFIRYDWFTANRWPHRLCSWVAAKLATPGLTHLRFVNDLRLNSELPPPSGGLPPVRRASPADLRAVEGLLRSRGEAVAIRSDDMGAAELQLGSLSARYTKHDLERGRAVFVVDGRSSAVAYALAEVCTPGVCWAEFTNACRLLVPDESTPGVAEAREALIRQCVQYYRSRGRHSVITLCSDREVPAFTQLGFSPLGRLGEFTFHKSIARQWQALVTAMFERLGDRELPIHPGSEEENERMRRDSILRDVPSGLLPIVSDRHVGAGRATG